MNKVSSCFYISFQERLQVHFLAFIPSLWLKFSRTAAYAFSILASYYRLKDEMCGKTVLKEEYLKWGSLKNVVTFEGINY